MTRPTPEQYQEALDMVERTGVGLERALLELQADQIDAAHREQHQREVERLGEGLGASRTVEVVWVSADGVTSTWGSYQLDA